MTDKVLFNGGYKEYPVSPFDEYVNRFFQKKIKDKKGIKYYIDVNEYELFDEYSYEFNISTKKENFYNVRILFHAIYAMTLEEIEEEIEKIWKSCGFDYYELY